MAFCNVERPAAKSAQARACQKIPPFQFQLRDTYMWAYRSTLFVQNLLHGSTAVKINNKNPDNMLITASKLLYILIYLLGRQLKKPTKF